MQKQIHDWKLAKYRCHLLLEAIESWKCFTNSSSHPNWRRNIECDFHATQHHGWKQSWIQIKTELLNPPLTNWYMG
jgi:hypothetical protein